MDFFFFIDSRGELARWFVHMEVDDGRLIGSILGGDDEGSGGMGYHSGRTASQKKKKKKSERQHRQGMTYRGKRGALHGFGSILNKNCLVVVE